MSDTSIEIRETISALCAKIQGDVMDNDSASSTQWADAVRDLSAGLVDVTEADQRADS